MAKKVTTKKNQPRRNAPKIRRRDVITIPYVPSWEYNTDLYRDSGGPY